MEADPSSIQELFNRNPFDCTQADISRISDLTIAYYRKVREDLANSATIRHVRTPKEPFKANEMDFSDL